MAGADIASAAAQIAGGLIQYRGAQIQSDSLKAAAQARLDVANFEAAQAAIQAGTAEASGQRTADAALLQTRMVNSQQLARAAASGAGASDPTVTNLMAFTRGVGSYNAAVALFEGEEAARRFQDQAKASTYEGITGFNSLEAQASVAKARGIASIIGAGGGLYEKYGQGGPPKITTSTNGDVGSGYIDAGTPSVPRV